MDERELNVPENPGRANAAMIALLAHTMRSLGRNSFWLLLARLTAQALAILFIAIVARRIDLDSFGQFTFISAVVLIGNTFTNFGTDTYIVREVARTRKTTPLLARALGLQLFFSALWWMATLLLRPNPALLIYSLSLFPLAFFSVATARLRGFERMDMVWSLSLLNGLFQTGAAFFSKDLWTLCLSLLLAQLLIAAICYWICFASTPDFRLFPFREIYPLLKATLPIALLTLLLVLSQRLGILTVSAMLGDSATGIFSSATRIVDGLKLGHYAVLGGLLPILARRTEESGQTLRLVFFILIVLSLGIAVGLSVISKSAITILFGENFSSAIPLLSMLGWILVPYTISSVVSYDLIAHEQEKILAKATAISLVMFVGLNILLISGYDLIGAVYAALIGETIQAILFVLLRTSLRLKSQAKSTSPQQPETT